MDPNRHPAAESPWSDTPRIAIGRTSDRRIVAAAPDGVRRTLTEAEFPAWVAAREAERRVRWVWASTAETYPVLLAAGVRVERCHDLRLCHAILKNAVPGSVLARHTQWDAPDREHTPALFDLETGPRRDELDEVLHELARHDDTTSGSADPARMRLLLAAESAGALVAAEARVAGVPWDADEHGRILDSTLGTRGAGGVPAKMSVLAGEVRAALGRVAKWWSEARRRSLRCVARCHHGRGLGADPGRVPACADARPPTCRSSHGGRGNRVAVPDRLSLARPARAIRELEHDLQELPPMGGGGRVGRPARPCPEARVSCGRDRLGRVGGLLDRARASAWRDTAADHRGPCRITRCRDRSRLITRSAGHEAV